MCIRDSVSADYYNRKTTDMLLGYTTATSSGFSDYNANIGSMRNTGFEFSLGGSLIKTTDFIWNLTGMGSTVTNKVLKLTGESPEIIKGVFSIKEGMPINTYYMAKMCIRDSFPVCITRPWSCGEVFNILICEGFCSCFVITIV